ncbi:hypothetical protein BCV69DRAFT_282821 [Microstroma glucosiphilum]|uniref:Uncharacterized protein n=1 Tax=Pseudomicrostroma glucosiphilum TaxID=1684307 RepID=A0A316U711_9BASI|nr:hypothetical protein BCV69DRAFT_282821 [Pseudomicrostroma glucosiphilum]PWN20608.1 hypothetical protein BCV69DRAFT_282821 [Pseudomicrostroma glucosiphilum]
MRINLYLTPSNPPASPVSLLGEPASSSSSSSASSVATSSRSSAPKPLLALCPNGELVLIELQGSLEMEGLDSDLSSASASAEGSASGGGQVVGEFSWGEGKEDKPTLLLSHHRLEGKLITLGRPLAVLEKRRRKVVRAGQDKEEEEAEGRATLLPSSPDLKMTTVAAENPLLEDSDDDEEGADAQGRGRSISPTVQRMKRDHALDPDHNQGSSSSTSLGPLSKKPKIDSFNSASTQTPSRPTSKAPPPPTSSPSSTPQAPMRGSALDFSSPQPPSSPPLPASRARAARVGMGMSSPLQERVGPNDQEEGEREGEADGRTPTTKSKSKTAIQATGEETPTQRGKQSAIPGGARKRQTSTYYDVVCIVRKKVLFSKRPEPVVHGLGAAAKK